MAATPSVKVTKTFTYRGVTKTFSNRYHFNGGTPADSAHWTTLCDNITAAEKLSLWPSATITAAFGYAAGSDVPVFSKTYSLAGTLTGAGTEAKVPGDAAALLRYSTTARTTKNHPVYLFNYYHACRTGNTGDGDTLAAAQVTAMQTYGTAWITGFSDGAITAVRAGPNGATAVSRLVEPLITHRDLRRA